MMKKQERKERNEGKAHLSHVDVEALALANKRPAVRGLVDDDLLLDLPHRLVQVLELLGQSSHALHAAAVGDDLVAHLRGPQAALDQVLEQVLVDHGELASQHAAVIHV